MNILIYTWATGIGDGIINSGYVRELKKIYPNAKIILLASPLYSIPYINNPNVDIRYNFIYFGRKFIKNIFIHLPIIFKLRKQKIDILIDLTSSYQKFNFKFIKAINAKQNIGLYKPDNRYKYSKEFLSKIYNGGLIEDKSGHDVNVFNFFNLYEKPKYDFFISSEVENVAINFFNKKPNEKIIIFNSEGSGKRALTPENIENSLKEIAKLPNVTIYVVSTKSSEEKINKIYNKLALPNVKLCLSGNFELLGALIKNSDLLISVDTSLIHLASAVGTKVVGIYANNARWFEIFAPRFVEYKIVKQEKHSTKDWELNGYKISDLVEATKNILKI